LNFALDGLGFSAAVGHAHGGVGVGRFGGLLALGLALSCPIRGRRGGRVADGLLLADGVEDVVPWLEWAAEDHDVAVLELSCSGGHCEFVEGCAGCRLAEEDVLGGGAFVGDQDRDDVDSDVLHGCSIHFRG